MEDHYGALLRGVLATLADAPAGIRFEFDEARAGQDERDRANAVAVREHIRSGITDGSSFVTAWQMLRLEAGLDAEELPPRSVEKAGRLVAAMAQHGSAATFDGAAQFLAEGRFGPDWPLDVFLSTDGSGAHWKVAGFRIVNAASAAARS